MFPIVDQRRRFIVDGRSCISRLVSVGDALSASNPSLARGTSFALMHAVALRDLLRSDEAMDTIDQRYHDWTESTFEPWWQATVTADKIHLERMRAAARGEEITFDPGAIFQRAAMHDPQLWRLALRIRMLLEHPRALLDTTDVQRLVGATIDRVGPPRAVDLDIGRLLAA
jgi:hypothetical protein